MSGDEDEEEYTCTVCGKPILRNHTVHGAMWDHEARTGMHWLCSSRGRGEDLGEMFERIDAKLAEALDALRALNLGDPGRRPRRRK